MILENAIQLGVVLLIGLAAGFFLGIYTAIHYRERDTIVIAQKAAAVAVGTTWITLHAYLILTGSGSLNVFWDAIGSAAVGELLGINLVQVVKSVRNK